MKKARQLLNEYSELGVYTFSDQEAEAALKSLISQVFPAKQGLELQSVVVDQEEDCVCAEILAAGNSMRLYFYMEDGIPLMCVDYDSNEIQDVEFDLRGLDPDIMGDMVDVSSIDKWMPSEILANVVFNDWNPNDARNESQSLDDWDRSGSGGDGSAVSERVDILSAKANEDTPRYTARVVWKDGKVTDNVSAKKSGNAWLIGGDFLIATTELGGQVFITDHQDGKVYWLKGNRMIFQDYKE